MVLEKEVLKQETREHKALHPDERPLDQASFLVYDMKHKKRLEDSQSASSSGALSGGIILFISETTPLLESLCDPWVQSLNRWTQALGRFEPTFLKQRLNRHLAPHLSTPQQNEIQRYFLVKRRLYSLNPSSDGRLCVLRQKALLEFSLSPEEFILLEPQDVLVLLPSERIKALKATGAWKLMLTSPSLLSINDGFLKIDDPLPHPNTSRSRGRKGRRIEWIGRWILFSFYATLTGLVLWTVFWIL